VFFRFARHGRVNGIRKEISPLNANIVFRRRVDGRRTFDFRFIPNNNNITHHLRPFLYTPSSFYIVLRARTNFVHRLFTRGKRSSVIWHADFTTVRQTEQKSRPRTCAVIRIMYLANMYNYIHIADAHVTITRFAMGLH